MSHDVQQRDQESDQAVGALHIVINHSHSEPFEDQVCVGNDGARIVAVEPIVF